MSLNISKEDARKASDEMLASVKNGTRSNSAPHQFATDELAYRHRKRMLSLGFKCSLVTAVLVGFIYVASRVFV